MTSCQSVTGALATTSFSPAPVAFSPFPDGQTATIKTINNPMEANPTTRPTSKVIHGNVGRRLTRKRRRRGLAGGSIGGAGSIAWFDCQSTQVPGAPERSAADSAAGSVNVAG